MQEIYSSFNDPRFRQNTESGHYESWFIRANHPALPQAFWIRYTIFCPKNRPKDAIGELWAIYFDGKSGQHTAAKSEFPIQECEFRSRPLFARIGNSSMTESEVIGNSQARPGSPKFEWNLKIEGGGKPLLLFPENLYEGGFPKAKVLVGSPSSRFTGRISVDGTEISILNWQGSQNHNWGPKHTDQYAWGQVAGFDSDSGAFLELATAQIKIGPFWTPPLTPIVFRFKEKEYRLNKIIECFGRADYHYFEWNFKASTPDILIEGKIHANPSDFVCLKYNNPPGGWKYCLNTKIARSEILVTLKGETSPQRLVSKNSAAFEILTSDSKHGLIPAV
ncbi:hypothetical protein CH373_11180 [Leptospira perolatii]|uniref:Tocopherol cyclase n=1 Tax=Leptospira perolatii TaxID=2023191 RepID=A0A2M9ZM18_9LEPT|nr:hypothetical protein [Leptospira perolatii]PJZ69734.1 hypothetical protein CH360_09055 [Leptospira perolatii]PJZ73051.1 hypothetical protein CH373_11180 [Leptospira perolatii]